MIPLVSGGFLLPTCGMRHHWKIELLEALKLSFLEWTLRFFGYQLTHINILSSGWVLIPSLVDSCAFCWWSNHARDLFLSISHSHQHPDGSMVMVQRSQTHIFWGFPRFSPPLGGKLWSRCGRCCSSQPCMSSSSWTWHRWTATGHSHDAGISEFGLGISRGCNTVYTVCVYIYIYMYIYIYTYN